LEKNTATACEMADCMEEAMMKQKSLLILHSMRSMDLMLRAVAPDELTD